MQTVADGPYEYPDVAVSGDNNVLMTWSGTSGDRFKFYRSSSDGGLSWSENVTISTLGGMQGYSGLAIDSAGRLHLGMAASCYQLPGSNGEYSGDGLIHSVWDGASLSMPEMLLANTIKENNLQYADIAISEGNIANIVVMYPIHTDGGRAAGSKAAQDYNFEIFYIRGVLDAPHIQPQPSSGLEGGQVAQPSIQVSPTLEIKKTATPVPLSFSSQDQNGSAGFEINPSISVMIGAVPALLIIGVLMAARLWYSKR